MLFGSNLSFFCRDNRIGVVDAHASRKFVSGGENILEFPQVNSGLQVVGTGRFPREKLRKLGVEIDKGLGYHLASLTQVSVKFQPGQTDITHLALPRVGCEEIRIRQTPHDVANWVKEED